MYIAFKWLFSMALAKWIVLCSIDFYLNSSAYKLPIKLTESNTYNDMVFLVENFSNMVQKSPIENSIEKLEHTVRYKESIFFQYVMFVAGACVVLIYGRIDELMMYTKRKIKTFNQHEIIKDFQKNIIVLKNTANTIRVAILKVLFKSMGVFKDLHISFINSNHQPTQYPPNINLILLNKLKQYSQERMHLGHLLISAIQENKNIRMRYQLETMAKKRLVRNIEDTQKQIKENRCRYVSFQQLYLITHQENIFLKSRLKKITKDKEDAEKNFNSLVNHLWNSKNSELKAYCSRFIVQSRSDLLNYDVKAEIEQFLEKTCMSKQFDQRSNQTHSSSTHNSINEIGNAAEEIIDLFKDAPKLRGLPGECVWTVKDKDGIIEKLYEFETDFDNGDTIRRIRQYSVYHDKDCLLDFSSSTTFIQNRNIDLSHLRNEYMKTRRITGSQAFQQFLNNYKYILLPRSSQSLLSLTN